MSYYDASMDEAARRRRELILDLRRAVDRGEFELHHQPQARLRPNTVMSGKGAQLSEPFDVHFVIGY